MASQTNTNNMGWVEIAGLIVQIGLPAAEHIFKQWSEGKDPTPEDFVTLRVLMSNTSSDLALKAVVDAGLDPNDPKIAAILALTK